jgi:hypothetical protein
MASAPIHHEEWRENCRLIRHRSQAPEYRGDLDSPLPCFGIELGMDNLTLWGEDVRF